MASAKQQPCPLCLQGVKYCSVIHPDPNRWPNNTPKDTFHSILYQVLRRGYCNKHTNHNTTDFKFLNGSELKKPTKRGIDIYQALFQRGRPYDEVVAKYEPTKDHRKVKEGVILPLCNVLAHGYDLNLELCGIPISNSLEEQIIHAIYEEVDHQQALPFRFPAKIQSMLPQWPLPLFIYAKLRGCYTRECEPELFCPQSMGATYTGMLPAFCSCNGCREDIADKPVQKPVITPSEQRQQMEASLRDAFARQSQKRKQEQQPRTTATAIEHKQMMPTAPAPAPAKQLVITAEQRQQIEANRLKALAIPAQNK